MPKGISNKRRLILTRKELESIAEHREFPAGKRITADTLVGFWLTTGTSKNEEWVPEDLVVLELVS
jgi:hypothetical protein